MGASRSTSRLLFVNPKASIRFNRREQSFCLWRVAFLSLSFRLGSSAALPAAASMNARTRPAWRAQAENACLAQHRITPSEYIQPAKKCPGPGICGLTRPFKVTALQGGAVAFNSTATLDCSMIAELDQWLAEVVQPAAQARFGVPVAQINSMGSYSCRGMNNQAGAQLSEHALRQRARHRRLRSRGRPYRSRSCATGRGATSRRKPSCATCMAAPASISPPCSGRAPTSFTTITSMSTLRCTATRRRGPRRICKPVPKTTRPGAAPRRSSRCARDRRGYRHGAGPPAGFRDIRDA